MPKWLDCSWKRIPCGKKSCKICGPLIQPEIPGESTLKNVEKILSQTLEIIKKGNGEQKAEFAAVKNLLKFESPEKFALVLQINDWRSNVFGLVRQSYILEKEWLDSEAAADVTWYSNVLCSKVYRQHLNRQEIEKGKRSARADYEYTQSVLKTCVRILRKATSLIYIFDLEHRDCWVALQTELRNLEKGILNI